MKLRLNVYVNLILILTLILTLTLVLESLGLVDGVVTDDRLGLAELVLAELGLADLEVEVEIGIGLTLSLTLSLTPTQVTPFSSVPRQCIKTFSVIKNL
jgi:hypothetical protein